jgi:hypothetical protein
VKTHSPLTLFVVLIACSPFHGALGHNAETALRTGAERRTLSFSEAVVRNHWKWTSSSGPSMFPL